MPDIPLKTFGKGIRTHTGYSRLKGDEDSGESGSVPHDYSRSQSSDTSMPSSSRVALLGKKRSKSQDAQHSDYADEEETLLANNDTEDDFDGRSEPRRRKEASLSVRSVRLTSSFQLQQHSYHMQRSADSKARNSLFSRGKTKDRSRTIPFRPPGMFR